MATYWEKLKDPRWQRKRLEILERDNWTCKGCGGTTDTLHVHHGFYDRGCDPWDYENSTLHTLCEFCHELIQERLRDVHYEIAKRSPNELSDLLYILASLREWTELPRPERARKGCWIVDSLSELSCADGILKAATEPLLSIYREAEIDSDIAIGAGCGV